MENLGDMIENVLEYRTWKSIIYLSLSDSWDSHRDWKAWEKIKAVEKAWDVNN